MEMLQETWLREWLLKRYGSLLREIYVLGTKALALVDGIVVPTTEEHEGWSITIQNARTREWDGAKQLFVRRV